MDLIELDAMLRLYNPRWSLAARATAAFELLTKLTEREIRWALEAAIIDPPEPRSFAGLIAKVPNA